MSTDLLQNEPIILDRLKMAKKLRSDTELADYLNVNTNTVAQWRKRGSVNLKQIVSKCGRDVDLNWLLRGSDIPPSNMDGPLKIKFNIDDDFRVSQSQSESDPYIALENTRLRAQVEVLKEILIKLKGE